MNILCIYARDSNKIPTATGVSRQCGTVALVVRGVAVFEDFTRGLKAFKTTGNILKASLKA